MSQSALPESVCKGCLNLARETWNPNPISEFDPPPMYHYYHNIEVTKVLRAAGSGCVGCRVILRVLEPYMKQLVAQPMSVMIDLGQERGIFVYGNITQYTKESQRTENILVRSALPESLTSTSSSCPWSVITSARIPSGYTGSSSAVACVRSWLDDCLNTHEKCQFKTGSQLPTRVVRIEGPTSVSLYETQHEIAEYACLSYCWGKEEFIQTNTSNREQHLINISWLELPKTFQDAISFAHALGIRYVWIDSLCIIQDSKDDWRHEGSKMAQVYDNAFLTLSAAWSSNPYEGCFSTCNDEYMPRIMHFQHGNNGTYTLYSQKEMWKYVSINAHPAYPLVDRGWVYQERILSKRIVHFMSLEIWWECTQCASCECNSWDHNVCSNWRWSKPSPHSWTSENWSTVRMQECWEEVVEGYTGKTLTYSSDIFPALQGLAHLVPRHMGRYLAGHWESVLVRSLCWYLRYKQSHQRGPEEWRAPSWSWASMSRRVYYDKSNLSETSPCATVLSARTVPIGTDPMGQISSGELELRGRGLWGEMEVGTWMHPDIPGLYFHQNGTETGPPRCCPQWDRLFDSKDGRKVLVMRIMVSNRRQYWLILRATDLCGEYERLGLIASERFLGDHEYLNELYENVALEMDVTIV